MRFTPPLNVRLLGHAVGYGKPRLAVGGTSRLKTVDSAEDGFGIIAGSPLEHHLFHAGVGDDRDPILRPQPFHDTRHGLLQKRKLLGVPHGTRHIHQQHEIRRRCLRDRLPYRKPEHDQLAFGVPGARPGAGGQREILALCGRSVVVVEVVQHLLDAHGARINRSQTGARPHEAAQVGIGGRVRIGRKRGKRLLGSTHERGLASIGVALAAEAGRRLATSRAGRVNRTPTSRVRRGR